MSLPAAVGAKLPEIVAAAKQQFHGYVEGLMEAYETRRDRRRERGVQVVNFVGHGRCGKDESASRFSKITRAEYGGATSTIVNPMIAWCLGLDEETSFKSRHDNRVYWYHWCCEFRKDDPGQLAKMLLGQGDIVVGTRSLTELQAAAQECVDVTVWINRLNIPPDPTMEYDAYNVFQLPRWDWIDNNNSEDGLANLQAQIERIATSLNMISGETRG
jgi:hypothetical protein